jgi:hypothetical protein
MSGTEETELDRRSFYNRYNSFTRCPFYIRLSLYPPTTRFDLPALPGQLLKLKTKMENSNTSPKGRLKKRIDNNACHVEPRCATPSKNGAS